MHEQTLEWEHLQWEENQPRTAAYYCPECQRRAGRTWSGWSRSQRASGRPTATAQDTKIRSAWIDGLLSPHVTHVEMATKWLACESDEQRQAFVNLYLGRPWKVRGDAPEWQRLYDRREEWPPDRLPLGVLILTAGVDVQKDRLEIRVWGWGRGQQCWLIDKRVIQGEPPREDLGAVGRDAGGSWRHERCRA